MSDARTAGALWAAVALCFPTLALSQAPSPKRDPVRGATGAIVQFEEAPGSAILYFEERGGMITSAPTVAPAGRGKKAAAAQPARKAQAVAQQPSKQASAALSQLAQRKLAPSDGAVTKP